MNSELLYALLMGAGWVFLIGWLLALMVAYAKAFHDDDSSKWAAISAPPTFPRQPKKGQQAVRIGDG
jgi:hypothetical protein